MTLKYVNEILEAIAKGTINGMAIGFWIFALFEFCKWLHQVIKRRLHSRFPDCKCFQTKEDKKETK